VRHRFRLLGVVILACGLAVCHGAVVLWPAEAFDASIASTALAVARVAGSAVAAVIGVLNVIAGCVVFLMPARD
jgi:hypothetical protein